MTFEEDFKTWLDSVQPDLKGVFSILKKRLSREPENLIKDLMEAEAYNARCCYLLAQAESFYDRAGIIYLPGKDGTTDLERKAMMVSSVAPIKEIRDKIEGMCSALKQRLILGESVLAYERAFNEHRTKETE